MGNLIRIAIQRLGMSVETRSIKPPEAHHARLLGDPVAQFGHAADPQPRHSPQSVIYGDKRQNRAA